MVVKQKLYLAFGLIPAILL